MVEERQRFCTIYALLCVEVRTINRTYFISWAFLCLLLLRLFQLLDAVSQIYQIGCLQVSEEHGSFTTVEL